MFLQVLYNVCSCRKCCSQHTWRQRSVLEKCSWQTSKTYAIYIHNSSLFQQLECKFFFSASSYLCTVSLKIFQSTYFFSLSLCSFLSREKTTFLKKYISFTFLIQFVKLNYLYILLLSTLFNEIICATVQKCFYPITPHVF